MPIDFLKAAIVNQKATETLQNILSKKYDNFDQYEEVNKIEDLDVAKMIIKRLLDKVNESEAR